MAYLTAQQVRDRARSNDLSDTNQFSDAEIDRLIAEFEEIAEDYCEVSFISRTETRTVELSGASHVILQPKITAITTFTVEGTASTVYVLEDTSLLAAGILPFDTTITGTLVVAYTYGYATTPAVVARACVQYVRACALRDDSGMGRDVIAQAFDGGTTRYSTPDKNAGRPTGYIEVDRLLNQAPSYRTPGVA